MKKFLVAFAACLSLSVMATPEKPPKPIKVTAAVALAEAKARADVKVKAAGGAANAVIQPGAAEGGKMDLAGAKLGGDVRFERAAPSISIGTSNPSPTTCDGPGVGIGGSWTRGSGLINFGIGERESCLGAQDRNSMAAAGFSQEDQQRRLCQVSTIAKAAKECKRYADEDARAAQAQSTVTPVAVPAPTTAGTRPDPALL